MNQHSSKASLFLMELIIAILVFSLASALCVQLFAKSHLLTEDTRDLNHAVSLAESAAEVFYGTNGSLAQMQAILNPNTQKTTLDDTSLSLFYDHSFSLCGETSASYQMTISCSEKDQIQTADIRVINLSSSEDEVYRLTAKRYTGGDSL